MAYQEVQLTHGGIAFYAQVVKGMIGAGWTIQYAGYDHPSYPVPAAQTNTLPIAIDTTGFPLDFVFQLPVMFMAGTITVKKDYVTDLTQGVDYDIDPDYGTITVLAGGLMDNGAGFGTGEITIEAGYEILGGWMVLQSTGVSGSETILVGLRFVNDSGVAQNPFLTGIEIHSRASGMADGIAYTENPPSIRSSVEHDVFALVQPNADVQVRWSLTLDRIIACGRANCFSSWFAAGMLQRMRPRSEQKLVGAHLGHTCRLAERSRGPVSKTNEDGDLSKSDRNNMGSVYHYGKGRFCDGQQDNVMLNANYWELEVGSPTAGYTASRRVIAAGSGATLDTIYFEVHNVIVGQDTDDPAENAIFGLWEGLYTVLCYEPADNLQIEMDGRAFRLWAVADSLTRFVAVEEI